MTRSEELFERDRKTDSRRVNSPVRLTVPLGRPHALYRVQWEVKYSMWTAIPTRIISGPGDL